RFSRDWSSDVCSSDLFGVPVAPAGGDVRIRADGSTSIGATALVASDAANAVAIGEDAQVTASNAVALGQGSVADEENTVSVGRAGHERRVVNVAAGVHSTDAVNVEQLQASRTSAVQSANAYTDARFRQALLDIDQLQAWADDRFEMQDQRIDRVGAMSTAM